MWSAVYGALVLLIGVCATAVLRAGEPSHVAAGPRQQPAPAWSARLGWFVLAAVPASLLVAITAKPTTDLAPVPLLWVVPLALYLVSFIVAFTPGRGGALAYRASTWLFPRAGGLLAWVLATGRTAPVRELVLLHLAVLLLAGVVCHGRLARGRPAPEHLTTFYIWLAAGGGGRAAQRGGRSLGLRRAHGAATLARPRLRLPSLVGPAAPRHAVATLSAVAVFVVRRRPAPSPRFSSAIAASSASWRSAQLPDGSGRELRHGTTRHGAQLAAGRAAARAHRVLPLLRACRELPRTVRAAGGLRTAAVIGLGVGSMACHARAGERWDFIDVDPAVERIARDPRHFTFLRDCPGDAIRSRSATAACCSAAPARPPTT